METFPWWTEKQKKLAEEVEDFVEENTPAQLRLSGGLRIPKTS
ncbi:MAG: hypothetical protein Q6352_016055 [Candidatus Freyrarchaeum guaymaensis]|nr:hypothetical protein [Candidatus Sigynarchaeota archaeon]